MRKSSSFVLAMVVAIGLVAGATQAQDGMTTGTITLKSIGPLAFGPDGVIFVSDPADATIYALDGHVGNGIIVNTEGISAGAEFANIGATIAGALGATSRDVQIIDMAVNPNGGQVLLAVTRGRGPDAAPLLMIVGKDGKVREVSLKDAKFSKAKLPNPADPSEGRRGNSRLESITDMAFVDGRVIVAGLSNEEFASNLRSIPFPFTDMNEGTSVEIYHGAHGRFETNAPVRTFVPYEINGDPHLLAAYTCTPLVRFPVSSLKAGTRVKGTTVAELGNRNRPLDMIVYNKDSKNFLLLANNSRGVMKIAMDGIDKPEGITEKVGGSGTAGQSYETIAGLEGVVQLDKLDNKNAVVLIDIEGELTLKTIVMP